MEGTAKTTNTNQDPLRSTARGLGTPLETIVSSSHTLRSHTPPHPHTRRTHSLQGYALHSHTSSQVGSPALTVSHVVNISRELQQSSVQARLCPPCTHTTTILLSPLRLPHAHAQLLHSHNPNLRAALRDPTGCVQAVLDRPSLVTDQSEQRWGTRATSTA